MLTPPRSPTPTLFCPGSRAVQYFREHVACVLDGGTESDFWQRSILQLGEAELSVRQALIAVGEMFEKHTQHHSLSLGINEDSFSESYQKALLLTAQRVQEPNAEPAALATCVLFLCLHCLQGNREQAVTLLRTGIGIMQKILSRLDNPHKFQNDPLATVFLPVFERLVILLRFFGEYSPHLRDSSRFQSGEFDEMLYRPRDFQDTRMTLHWLLSETHDLLVKSRVFRLTSGSDQEGYTACLQRQGLQLAAYATWYEGFEELSHDPAANPTTRLQKTLRLSYSISLIWLSTMLYRYETLHKNNTAQYEEVLRNAEDVMKDLDPASLSFTFDMGLIPPLYWTAMKCRDISIRQRAIALLKEAPAREGLWNREEVVRTATRVLDLETSEVRTVGRRIEFRNALICEARIKGTDEEGTHVEFYAKQNGSADVTMSWKECIPLWFASDPSNLIDPTLS